MNKKLRNLKRRMRSSKKTVATLNSQISSLQQQVKDGSSKLFNTESKLRKSEDNLKSAISKDLECFRIAVNSSRPFHSHACEIFNVQMQIDMRSFEYGMFQAASKKMMPMCQVLNYVEHHLARSMVHKIQDYLTKKGIDSFQ